MRVFPSRDAFVERFGTGRPQVVWTRLVADLETPVSAFMKVAQGRPGSFLLESVEGGAVRARYSIIGLDPDAVLKAKGDTAWIDAGFDEEEPPEGEKTLEAIRRFLAESAIELPEELPPMAAGIFGYLGYHGVRLVEDLPDDNPDPLGLPDSILVRPKLLLIFDNVADAITVVTPVRPGDRHDADTAGSAYDRAIDRLTEVIDALDRPLAGDRRADGAVSEIAVNVTSNTTPARYLDMVRQAKSYIEAGDVFQVVLSQRFAASFTLEPFALYRALRRTNPSPFLFFLDYGAFSIVGSSPEILVRVRSGEVTIRPIAGTRPRGATPEDDRRLGAELLADEKERAEHLMLLDLGRNDVGRVSEIGSVRVTDQFFLEHYSHVMHIVSNVVGKLRPDQDVLSALFAGFPAGTVSGAPKLRAMEIIDELESERRGVYAGCVGYFSAGGDMDTCIVLRTAVVKDGQMFVQAGAGIVADSIPEAEQAECVNKAKALFNAAEEAHRFASSTTQGQ